MIRRPAWSERGDTLVEVTMALAILSAVLTSAYVMANRAYLAGQVARERTQIVTGAQQQAEALRIFRDEHTWTEFFSGNSLKGFQGVNVRNSSGDCDPTQAGTQRCFHMQQARLADGTTHWVPAADVLTPIPGIGSYVGITLPNPVAVNSADFMIVYGSGSRGGGVANRGTLPAKLANTDGLIP